MRTQNLYYYSAHLMKMISVTLFIAASAFASHYLSLHLSSFQISFIVYLISVPLLFVIYIFSPNKQKNATKKRKNKIRITLYAIRVLCTVCAKYCWLESIARIGVNNATAMLYLTPIFSILLSVSFMKERIMMYWLMPFLLAIAGVWIVIRGEDTLQQHYEDMSGYTLLGFQFAITAAFLYSIYNIVCKKQSEYENFLMQAIYTFLGSVFVLAIILFVLSDNSFDLIVESLKVIVSLMDYHHQVVFNKDAIMYNVILKFSNQFNILSFIAFIIGIFTLSSVVLNFLAYNFANVSELAIHDYFRIIITTLFMYCVGNVVPSTDLFIGVALIVLGNIFILKRPASSALLNTKRTIRDSKK